MSLTLFLALGKPFKLSTKKLDLSISFRQDKYRHFNKRKELKMWLGKGCWVLFLL